MGSSVDVLEPTERLAIPQQAAPAASGVDQAYALVLAEILGTERVSPDSHFFADLGADSLVMAQFCARVRKRPGLPPVSMKDIYQHPTIAALSAALAPAPSRDSDLESAFARLLADVTGVESVSPDSHFLADLGADSLVMAHFCARIRKRPDLPPVSMKDIYQHPTIAALAAALTRVEAGPAAAQRPALTTPAAPKATDGAAGPTPRPVGTATYVLCAVLQFLILCGYAWLAALILVTGVEWIMAAASLPAVYLRSVLFAGVGIVTFIILPIVAKWLLIGRWKPQQIRIWSLAYVRFWAVKSLVATNPLVLFAGTPLYLLYLRALGARIGRDVVVLSANVPICTDLLSIGDGAVLRQGSSFTGYRAHTGMIQIGAIGIGSNAFVGEASVLDIDTALDDGAQLGHSSALHRGQMVPAGERWHGSPAQRTGTDYRAGHSAPCSRMRKVLYSAVQLFTRVLVTLPLGASLIAILLVELPQLNSLIRHEALALATWPFYRDALVASTALFFVGLAVGLLVVVTVPRLLNLVIKPGRVYPLYGIAYAIYRTIARLTNVKSFTRLFGDSSYIVGYNRRLGYDLNNVQQTGSNFGLDVRHEIPYLTSVGSMTMAADGLSIVNSDCSSSSFRLSATSIGARNFLGNRVVYPAQGRTGDNCLLATKVMVPIDGEIREGVGLLGSPPFEIPRTVERDDRMNRDADELRRGLAAKNRHNLATIGLYLFVRWLFAVTMLLLAGVAVDLYSHWGTVALAAYLTLIPFVTATYFVLVERLITAVHPLRPLYCSIYDCEFWRRERYWKVCGELFLYLFNGTPFKNVIWRLLGVRVGRRVFDDGCWLSERSMTTIGDDCVLNAGTDIQCHSQEDGAFKSDTTNIGAGCTIGVGAFVHYGVTMGEGAVLAPDSFLMKGEEVPAHAQWGGNPARPLTVPARSLRTVLPGPSPTLRLVRAGRPAGRALTLWSRPATAWLVIAGLATLVWVPQIVPGLSAGLRDQLATMIAALAGEDSALAGQAAMQAFLLVLPALAVGAVAIALGVTAVRRIRSAPSAAKIAEPVTRPVPSAGSTAGARSWFDPARRALLPVASLVVGLGVLAVPALSSRVATAGEAALAAAAALPPGSPLAPLSIPDTAAAAQIAVLNEVVAALDPQSVVDDARVSLLAVGLLGSLLLWVVARRMALTAPGAALAVALSGLLVPQLTGLYGSVDPGALAAVWLTVAAAVVWRSRGATAIALVAALIAVLTAPLAAVGPLTLAAHGVLSGVFAARRPRAVTVPLGVALALAAAAVAVWSTGLWTIGAAPVTGSGLDGVPAVLTGVLTFGAVAVLLAAWFGVPGLRPVVSSAAALLACAAVPGPQATTALLLAVPMLAVLAATVADDLAERARFSRRALLGAVLVAGAAAAWPFVAPGVATPAPDRTALTAWIDAQLDPTTELQVDPLTGAQLVRDGVAAQRLIPATQTAPPGTLTVLATRPGGSPNPSPAGAARVLVTVADGPGGGTVSVFAPEPGPDEAGP